MFSSSYRSFHLSEQVQAATHFPDIFIPRDADSHKGTHGTLAVIGGAVGMSGAIILAATAALYNGCGKVWAGFNQNMLPLPVIPEHPEIMLATAAVLQRRQDISAWVVGCGLDVYNDALHIVQMRLEADSDKPLLLDADALNLLARHKTELEESAQDYHTLVLTPHPAEAARLLGITTAEIQADRVAAVQRISEMFQAYTVLKGNQTLVCDPNGQLYTNHSGNPGLGTAGSGDVLSGIIGSLLAQGIETWQAVCGGVWLHGAAADVLRDSEIGETGIVAGEVAPAARWLRNQIIRMHHPAHGSSD
ncbi:NAD(P)H-hydrate dehydratase [Neisseria montereyensis]|uniref:ADP-dependent (S)-NAD(P)H-hydrate dehydratase n=1 Tax=Neisseria montereyensis TaxID=2973938 RepID=A0ABT2FC51_9NEIS|nr:NAD(P)H-hydrate dehydratase [Neisseria montereyensis]MCS4533781.1 NAD(P)H-hydrate dehydratase [Neisseria montereyensis]